MIPSYKVGKTRIKLAQILQEFCGASVYPSLLLQNYENYRLGRHDGFAYSWYYDGEREHPLSGIGSPFTMTEFVRLSHKGWIIQLYGEELFLIPPINSQRRIQ